jgi:hypothetical protein
MEKIAQAKLDRTFRDIWNLLEDGITTNNMAIIHQNLIRLHKLQLYYRDLLFFQDTEIIQLKEQIKYDTERMNLMETDFLNHHINKSQSYERIKQRSN